MPSTHRELLPFIPSDVLPKERLDAFVPLRGGHSSRVYLVGDQVLKFSKFVGTPEQAENRTRVLQCEHDLITANLGEEYTPQTTIRTIAADVTGDKARVLTQQPLVPGSVIEEALKHPVLPTGDIQLLLRRSLEMFRATKKMPDIAHLEHGFRFKRTPNLLVDLDSGHPTLVDTNFGRTQRKPYIGYLFSVSIAHAARRELQRLEH